RPRRETRGVRQLCVRHRYDRTVRSGTASKCRRLLVSNGARSIIAVDAISKSIIPTLLHPSQQRAVGGSETVVGKDHREGIQEFPDSGPLASGMSGRGRAGLELAGDEDREAQRLGRVRLHPGAGGAWLTPL